MCIASAPQGQVDRVMPRHPETCLRPGVEALLVEDNLALLNGPQPVVLSGRAVPLLVSRLLPLLDGAASPSELASHLGVPPDAVEHALGVLSDRRLMLSDARCEQERVRSRGVVVVSPDATANALVEHLGDVGCNASWSTGLLTGNASEVDLVVLLNFNVLPNVRNVEPDAVPVTYLPLRVTHVGLTVWPPWRPDGPSACVCDVKEEPSGGEAETSPPEALRRYVGRAAIEVWALLVTDHVYFRSSVLREYGADCCTEQRLPTCMGTDDSPTVPLKQCLLWAAVAGAGDPPARGRHAGSSS
ncbi:MAG: hypothetical protein ACREX3_01505 [Gammaproteobacteria bacterium]